VISDPGEWIWDVRWDVGAWTWVLRSVIFGQGSAIWDLESGSLDLEYERWDVGAWNWDLASGIGHL
jgi:hypothetical protein